MENWLHSGIDKNVLEQEFIKLKKMKFPERPFEDELYDLFSELVSLDGHIAGLVSSYLKDRPINCKLLDADGEFNDILGRIEIESESIDIMVDYKKHIDLLVQMLKLLCNTRNSS